MRRQLLFLIFALPLCGNLPAQVRTLDYYVGAALHSSPVINDYSMQVRRSAFDSSVISATKRPQVSGIGNIMLAPAYKGWGYDEAVTNGANYEAIASVHQTVFSKKIYAPQYESVRLDVASATNSSKLSAHELEHSITTQYLVAYASLSQLNYNRELLKLVADEQKVLESFVNQGIYRQTDYLALDLEKQLQELQIEQLNVQYRADLGELNALCGIEDTGYYELAAPRFNSQNIISSSMSSFRAQFHIDSLRIINSRRLIDTRYRSSISWFADAGLQSSRFNTIYRNFGFSFGLSFVIPIFDGRQRGFEYQKLSVNESIRTNYQQFFSLQQRVRISQIEVQLAGNEQLILREKNMLKTSETLVNANKMLLEKGQASVSDFILALKNNIEIKNQLNQAELTRLQLNNDLTYWNW